MQAFPWQPCQLLICWTSQYQHMSVYAMLNKKAPMFVNSCHLILVSVILCHSISSLSTFVKPCYVPVNAYMYQCVPVNWRPWQFFNLFQTTPCCANKFNCANPNWQVLPNHDNHCPLVPLDTSHCQPVPMQDSQCHTMPLGANLYQHRLGCAR